MRAVNISKSLMIIGGIEKYAALKKKKQKASTAVQHKVLQKPTKKEVEQEEEKKHGKHIEAMAKKLEGVHTGANGEPPKKQELVNGKDENNPKGGQDVPYADVPKEQLTQEERNTKAAAIVANVVQRSGPEGETH
ncbi:hypothetical protein BT69DRAFT_862033 [Atractiella rhizophila]|nr:hypothetical protein BT69DRAFT_862033 [Atractiella rhizophila]